LAAAGVVTGLAYLIPAAVFLGLLGLGAFLWSVRSGQYDDLDGAAWRALSEDEDEGAAATGFDSTSGPSTPGPSTPGIDSAYQRDHEDKS